MEKESWLIGIEIKRSQIGIALVQVLAHSRKSAESKALELLQEQMDCGYIGDELDALDHCWADNAYEINGVDCNIYKETDYEPDFISKEITDPENYHEPVDKRQLKIPNT